MEKAHFLIGVDSDGTAFDSIVERQTLGIFAWLIRPIVSAIGNNLNFCQFSTKRHSFNQQCSFLPNLRLLCQIIRKNQRSFPIMIVPGG